MINRAANLIGGERVELSFVREIHNPGDGGVVGVVGYGGVGYGGVREPLAAAEAAVAAFEAWADVQPGRVGNRSVASTSGCPDRNRRPRLVAWRPLFA